MVVDQRSGDDHHREDHETLGPEQHGTPVAVPDPSPGDEADRGTDPEGGDGGGGAPARRRGVATDRHAEEDDVPALIGREHAEQARKADRVDVAGDAREDHRQRERHVPDPSAARHHHFLVQAVSGRVDLTSGDGAAHDHCVARGLDARRGLLGHLEPHRRRREVERGHTGIRAEHPDRHHPG